MWSARRISSSWAAMAGQPIARSSPIAASRATAPRTLGDPASSRSGGSVHTTSSRSTEVDGAPTGEERVALLMDGGTASVYGPRAWAAYREFAIPATAPPVAV